MKVIVLSREQFKNSLTDPKVNITNDNIEEKKKVCFISINNTDDKEEEIIFKENKENLLIQYFDDVTEDISKLNIVTGQIQTAKCFTQEQAREIIQFLDRNKDKEFCFVHCTAGVSRSGAVGEFVNDFFNKDYYEFKKNNPYTQPNAEILRILRRELREMVKWIFN